MRYFSMFSGIGGFELGIEKATGGQTSTGQVLRYYGDSTINKSRIEGKRFPFAENIRSIKHGKSKRSRGGNRPTDKQHKWKCVGYSEIDKYAIQIYQRHFPDHKNYGDATKLIPEKLPDFDLLVAGFPCQSFSIAGNRRGFDDTRGTLFFDICRVLRVKRPSYCLLENVKGLLNHDKGKTFEIILESLAELGYDCQWQVLNSKYFGVPQNRERVFIIGYLREKTSPEVFPIGEGDEGDFKEIQQRFTIRGRNKNAIGSLDTRGVNAFDRADLDHIIYEPKIRRLTPLECERLQGFPDGWTGGVSDTQRYKCLGNAVTVNVVREIIRRLVLCLKPA